MVEKNIIKSGDHPFPIYFWVVYSECDVNWEESGLSLVQVVFIFTNIFTKLIIFKPNIIIVRRCKVR